MIGVVLSEAKKRFSIDETGLIANSGPISYSKYIVKDSAIFSGLKILISRSFSKLVSLSPKETGMK
jgi:hypothetical protein